MDFIEKIFRISPDGGTGTLEAALVVALAVVATLVVLVLKRAKASRCVR